MSDADKLREFQEKAKQLTEEELKAVLIDWSDGQDWIWRLAVRCELFRRWDERN